MVHILLQYYVQSLLPPGEVQLEHRFAAINRIADAAWLSRKIVFEVQCSPITAQEVEARNADYASAGFQTVWLLHDSRYNQHRLTGAENVLRCWPHYFTDMDNQGTGCVYDQAAFVSGGLRKERLPRLTVDLSKPLGSSNQQSIRNLPMLVLERLSRWPVYFRGDILDACLEGADYLNLLFDSEKKNGGNEDVLSLSLWEFVKLICNRWIAYPYRAILRLLLERASR